MRTRWRRSASRVASSTSPSLRPDARDPRPRDPPPPPARDRRARGLQRTSALRGATTTRRCDSPASTASSPARVGRARAPGRRHGRAAHARVSTARRSSSSRCGPRRSCAGRSPSPTCRRSSGWPRSRRGCARGEHGPGSRDAVPTDEIYERYLKKAIAEINELGTSSRALGDALHVPVLGSGHPLADVFLLKWSPQPSEIQEGVAFFGRSGQALLKSFERLGVDPLAVYGTNCLKFGTEDAEQRARLADAGAPHRPAEARRRDGRARGRVPERPRVPALRSGRSELGRGQRSRRRSGRS